MDAALLLRTARRRSGLTQKDLARRAATTQSSVAAYETGAKQPSMATLTRLVAAADLSVVLTLVPARSPVPGVVEAIGRSVSEGSETEALRMAADLFTRLAALAPPDVAAFIADDPGSTGDQRWDALIGGLVERAAHRAGVRTPAWTAATTRFLDRWWFVTPYRSLHASALVEAPAELANRGVFVHEISLHSV
ncbi:MAG: helix-turn-helix domain-containing protein [Acidimicrobiales bacterium]